MYTAEYKLFKSPGWRLRIYLQMGTVSFSLASGLEPASLEANTKNSNSMHSLPKSRNRSSRNWTEKEVSEVKFLKFIPLPSVALLSMV